MQATAKEFIIALDEGTTNAKAVVLDSRGKVIVKFSQPLAIQTPRDGWVEQSGEALVTASLTVIASAVAHVGAETCGIYLFNIRPAKKAPKTCPSAA